MVETSCKCISIVMIYDSNFNVPTRSIFTGPVTYTEHYKLCIYTCTTRITLRDQPIMLIILPITLCCSAQSRKTFIKINDKDALHVS